LNYVRVISEALSYFELKLRRHKLVLVLEWLEYLQALNLSIVGTSDFGDINFRLVSVSDQFLGYDQTVVFVLWVLIRFRIVFRMLKHLFRAD